MAFYSLSRLIGFCALVSWSQQSVYADEFMGRKLEAVNPAKLRALLMEIENHFGSDSTKQRLSQLETRLGSLYAALPKNDRGGLSHATVRYALHRYFKSRHGWSMSGLDPNGGAWNATSATDILQDRVPAYIQNLFDEHLSEHVFGLHELTVFVAALENLVKIESASRIEAAYSAVKFATETTLFDDQVDKILDTNFLIYMFAENISNASWVTRIRNPQRVYPGWEDTQIWMRDTRQSLAYVEQSTTNPFVPLRFSYNNVLEIAEEILDKHGQFHNAECRSVKETLLAHEYKGTGRIRLADFYGMALDGDWRFSEKVDFLNQLGALDEETDPDDPRIIIPNYIYGKSNCMANSPYFSVCCPDECEALLGHLDRTFAAPVAEPARIAAEVAQLSSSTVAAPRNLSVALVSRLDDIAATHSGAVPLHGRLFAQFMHHAFPRECAYPHISGTTKPLTTREWRQATGERATHQTNAPELQVYGEQRTVLEEVPLQDAGTQDDLDFGEMCSAVEDAIEAAPWTHHEELVVEHDMPMPTEGEHGFVRKWARPLLMVAAGGGMIARLMANAQTAGSHAGGDTDFSKKAFV